jgi:DNA-binding NtrC family response regulator
MFLHPASTVQLVADRFAVHEDGRAFDLATGAPVTLISGSAGGVSEQLRWTERCGVLRALRHRAVAPLVDFGLVGESSRFEAWGCGGVRRGREDVGSLHAIATRWLRACGLSGGALSPDAVRTTTDGSGVWIPDAGSGYPAQEEGEPGELGIADCGLRMVEQPAVTALAEMFHTAGGARPHVTGLWGPPGAGKRVLVGELARIARTKGFVPVAARLIDSRQAGLWRGRSLFVIADGAAEGVWSAFLNAALRDAQPHVLLLVGEDECRSIGGVVVRSLPVDALASAIRPQPLSGRLERTVRRAAERAHGLPGRFARLLWPGPGHAEVAERATARSRLPRVAEQPAVYGRDETADGLFDAAPLSCAWPAPGELAALRRKKDHAIADLARGRHAPGIRQLRQTVGGLARRGAWSDAANGALALAGSLLQRGRTREAHAAIDDGRDYATRAGEEVRLVDLGVLSGEAWIDMGRLDEADSVLGTAMAAARALLDPERVAAASCALARGSYWRGHYADAEAVLAAAPDLQALRVRRGLLASRIAVGQGDLNRAMSLLAGVSELPAADHNVTTHAAVACVTAFVHLSVGDLSAAERDVSETLVLARAARDPLRATRARLLRAEVERRRGRPAAALGQLQRLRRVMATMPPTVRARWDVAMALSAPDANARDVVARHVQRSGLGALALYVATPRGAGMDGDGAQPFADELVAILRLCQTAADEIGLLAEVCGRLRRYLHAAAVGFVAVHGARVITSDGARLDTDIAERAASAGITIAPHRHHDRIEAAAPVEYGGTPIGALCARWTIGSTYDTSRAASVLTMSAAAAAPMLAAVLARQAHAAAGPGELLGVTPAIVELRASVERAAAAPFAVFIAGESGSGKELVARAVHRGSPRRHKPFCTLNCAALPDDLVEAELFGHARGAFTGAVADRAGVFEEAHGGTLFLDEIGELTPRAQAKVLRVIQEGELRRVGENVSRRVDVRIVSATNRALHQDVESGRFRLDLLYRLDVVHITVPPLRERREDVAVLADHVWRDATMRVGSRATLGAATIAALARYDWPGNVRELQNVLASLAVRSPKRGVVPPSALPPSFADSGPGEAWRLDEARRTFELRFVRAALVRSGGHRGRAAAELGVTRQGLTKLMTRLGIAR